MCNVQCQRHGARLSRRTYPRVSWKCCRSRRKLSRSLSYATDSLPRTLAMVRAYGGGTRPIPSFAAATLHTCHYCKTSTTSVNMTDSGSARESVGTLRDIGRPRRRYCSPPALGMQPRGRRPGSRRLPALARRCTHSDRGNNAQNHRTRGRRTYSYTDNDTRAAESHGFARPTVIRNLDTRENVHNELYRTNP